MADQSRVAQLLAAKRQAMVDAMHGRESDVDEQQVDAELRKVKPPPPPPRESNKRARLRFSPHARKRMSQRGMGTKVVYAIWTVGEPSASGSETVYTVTDSALADAPHSYRVVLEGWQGAAIVVAPPDEPGGEHRLCTVIAYGRDARTFRNK